MVPSIHFLRPAIHTEVLHRTLSIAGHPQCGIHTVVFISSVYPFLGKRFCHKGVATSSVRLAPDKKLPIGRLVLRAFSCNLPNTLKHRRGSSLYVRYFLGAVTNSLWTC